MAQEGRNEVLFLARDRLFLYDGSAVLTLEFPANVVHDLDIKNRDGLYNLIVTFIQNNKLVPAQIFFVLSEAVCFSKDFPAETPEVEEFITNIPFASVVSKSYKVANSIRVVGSNKDLIDTIFDAFEAKGFGLSALVPANIFPEMGVTTELTPQNASDIIGKREMAVGASMVGERTVKEEHLATTQTAVPKNKILPYLLIGFAVLLIVLVVVLMTRK